METIGDRVRRLREAKGIARKDLARCAGMSYTGLSDLESGKAKTTTKLHRLASILGIDVNYLETGKSSTAPSPQEMELQSQSRRLDAEMILDVLHSLQDVFKEMGLTYSVEEYPELFAEFCEDRLAMRDIRSKAGAVKVGQWIERKTPQGAETDERNTQVPAQGTHKGSAGRKRS